MNQQSSFVKTHLPCWSCDSSDAVGLNSDGSAKCFSAGCGAYTRDYHKAINGEVMQSNTKPYWDDTVLEFGDIVDRKITELSCRTYGVQVVKSEGKITRHYYPYFNSEGEKAAYKVRAVDKKNFFSTGNINDGMLFGQQAFKGGGKYVTVVEGELDALAAHQMMGNKWPVLSLRNGAGSAVADIKKSLEYLESFDNVVLCFDMDAAGQDKLREAAKLFTPTKCKVMVLPSGFKDACDMLKANKGADFVNCFWNAQAYIPSGIVDVTKAKDKYFDKRPDVKGMPYPWAGLNAKTYGMRKGELVTWTGGTGGGKSSITRELEHYIIASTTTEKVGVMALEENYWRTVDGIMSIEANTRLHVHQVYEKYPKDQLAKHYSKLFEGNNAGRVYVHAHLGIQDFDDIMSKLRYMVVGCGCDYIILDHLHMLIQAANGNSEREIIDEIMLRLRSLVEETNCSMHLVSHLRRLSGDVGHEQGAQIGLAHLRGSHSISQLSDMVIAAERDQQADGDERNLMKLRVLKNRAIGDTGPAATLRYDSESGRLTEIDEELEFEGGEF